MTSMYSIKYNAAPSTQSRNAAPAKQANNTVNRGDYAGLKVELKNGRGATSFFGTQRLIQGHGAPAPTTVAFGRTVPLRIAKNESATPSSVGRQSATSRLGSAQPDILGNKRNKPVTLPADFKQSELPRAANVGRKPAVAPKKTNPAPTAKKQSATSLSGTAQRDTSTRKPNPRWVF